MFPQLQSVFFLFLFLVSKMISPLFFDTDSLVASGYCSYKQKERHTAIRQQLVAMALFVS